MRLSFYWPGCLILPHYGFLRSSSILLHSRSRQSIVILHSEIQRLSLVLHSGGSIPPHWLLRLEFVVRLARHPSCITSFSFVTWGRWLEWLVFPKWHQIDDAKNHQLRSLSKWMDDAMMGRVSYANLQPSFGKEWNTPMWCLPKTLCCLSQKERKLFREKLTWSDFWMSICVYHWIPLFLSFIVVSCLNG